MLLAIPYQTLEVGKVHMDPFKPDRKHRPLASLTYRDASVETLDLTLVTPALPVASYDPARNRLVLDTTAYPIFNTKFTTLQEYIVSAMHFHRATFFGKDIDYEELHGMLQPLLVGQQLTVYIHPSMTVHKEGGGQMTLSEVVGGAKLRVVIRIHGILQFEGRSGATQLRIQHSIPKIYMPSA
jgi:hypothetical protein